MESLLSPSESHAFQSFLTAINNDPSIHEWAIDIDVPKDKQALAKATKELMSLDPASWHSTSPDEPPASATAHTQQTQHSSDSLVFPFLNRSPPISVTPSNLSLFLPHRPSSDSSSRTPTPTSASPFPFPPPSASRSLAASSSAFGAYSSTGSQSKRPRHSYSYPQPYPASPSSPPTSHSLPHQPTPTQTRARRSQSQPQEPVPGARSHAHHHHHHHHPPSSSSSTSASAPAAVISGSRTPTSPPSSSARNTASISASTSQKSSLLSASQKKANHIQSEQKRRANIRRGYDALCQCVPALREAIREEEEAAMAEGTASSSRARKGKMALRIKDGDEKIDGRAGPRSENVVLSKTIEYIHELLDERSALLVRLHRARSTLPPGHPALAVPLRKKRNRDADGSADDDDDEDDCPLWEREWKGGAGFGDGDGDESS